MTDFPDVPHVLEDTSSEVLGSASLALWTVLVRALVDKGILSSDDVRGMIGTAHDAFAKDQKTEQVMALLARLAMNVV